jgi:hypothetical protein
VVVVGAEQPEWHHVPSQEIHPMKPALRPHLALATALTLLVAVSAPVAASDEVTFKGRLAGTVIVTPLEPPMASVLIDASGTASGLGSFSVQVPHLVNQATRIGAGSYIFTAANGDTLTAEFSGEATLVAPGILSVHETATISGGTGRFAGAIGSFTVDRTFYLSTGETVGSFAGTISPPDRR